MTRSLLGPLLVALIAGCSDDLCDTAEGRCEEEASPDPYNGAVAMQQLGAGCSGDRRWLDVVVTGQPAEVIYELLEVELDGDVAWEERHRVPVFVDDPDGWWQNRYLELTVLDTEPCETLTDCAARFRSGANTLFSCGDDTLIGPAPEAVGLTHVLQLIPQDSRRVQECYAWGARPEVVARCETVEEP